MAKRELRKAGLHFVAKRVHTRDEFIRALEEFHPDVILSDYKLPNLNGIAALEFVRRDHPEVPVIMVTGALTQSIAEPDPAIPHQNFTIYPPGL